MRIPLKRKYHSLCGEAPRATDLRQTCRMQATFDNIFRDDTKASHIGMKRLKLKQRTHSAVWKMWQHVYVYNTISQCGCVLCVELVTARIISAII